MNSLEVVIAEKTFLTLSKDWCSVVELDTSLERGRMSCSAREDKSMGRPSHKSLDPLPGEIWDSGNPVYKWSRTWPWF